MRLLDRAGRRSRFLFDVIAHEALFAHEQKLDALTGQPATHARPSAGLARDSAGVVRTVPYALPAFEWGTLDFEDGVQTVGLRLAGDTLVYPFRRPPCALTVYLRFARGAADVPGAAVLAIGGLTGARFTLTESAASGYTATYSDGTTVQTSTVGTRLAIGDRVELRATLASGGLTLYQSIAGGTEEAGPTSAAITYASTWSAWTLSLGADAVGANPARNTYVRAAVALGTVAIDAFRPRGRIGHVTPASDARQTEAGAPRETESSLTLQTEGAA